MYRYDEFDAEIVRERAAEFRGQVTRRLKGEITEDHFKPLRLMNGLYLQLHAYMLRVAIPYGVLSSRQLRGLGDIARRFDRGYGHFTTRQNIQFNWIKLADAPDILDALAEFDMHAIQTSGNCIRNVTSDEYAAAAPDEIEDPRVWCEIIRQWSTLHPEFSFLPRKFKIAVTGAETDRAAVRVHDIGLHMRRNAAGDVGFEVIVGGGLGRTPRVGETIREWLPKERLLSYLEAILRVYNRYGRRDNLYKARIKILVEALGVEAFRKEVDEEWALIDAPEVDLPEDERARIAAYFAPPAFAHPSAEERAEEEAAMVRARTADAAFARWLDHNVKPHREGAYAIVDISLKPVGAAPGDATADQLDAIAALAAEFAFDEARVTHLQNVVLPHVRRRDLYTVYQRLAEAGIANANSGLATDIVACPGLDYCNLANARSIPIAQELAKRVEAAGIEDEIGDVRINISGCINACGHHHVGHIGVLGVDKKGEEFYQVTLGGDPSNNAAIGEIVGKGLSAEETVSSILRLLQAYLRLRNDNERFIEAYRRLGAEPFKEAIYADH